MLEQKWIYTYLVRIQVQVSSNIFFLIFRLMIYTYVFFFSLSGVLFTREYTIPQLNETVKHDKMRDEPENRLLLHTVTVMFARAFGIF